VGGTPTHWYHDHDDPDTELSFSQNQSGQKGGDSHEGLSDAEWRQILSDNKLRYDAETGIYYH